MGKRKAEWGWERDKGNGNVKDTRGKLMGNIQDKWEWERYKGNGDGKETRGM